MAGVLKDSESKTRRFSARLAHRRDLQKQQSLRGCIIRKRTPVPVSFEGVVVLLCGVGLVGGNGSANKLPNLESSYGK